MAEYQIKWGNGGRYAGSSLPKARLMAIRFLEENKHVACVGIFGNTDETVRTQYGRVGRTNAHVYYTWETPVKGGYGGYKVQNFLSKYDGRIVYPAQWFFHDGNFYY